MATNHRQRVFIECQTREYMLAFLFLATNCHLQRWQLRCGPSPLNPCSADIELLEFQGEEDLRYLRSLPGVVKVGTYESDVPFRNPEEIRDWVLSTPWAHHMAA